MGMPYVPPEQPPAQEKPVEVNNTFKQQQEQIQDQLQNQNNTVGELLQQQQTESDADSSADSTSSNSSQMSNIQVNNTSNRVEWDGIKVPTTTLNISSYVTERGDFGGVIGVNIPLGNRATKTINRAAQRRADLLDLQFEREYTSTCSSISEQGYVVARDANYAQMLAQCGNNITMVARKVDVPPPPPVIPNDNRSEVDLLRQQNILLQQRIDILMKSLEQKPVNGGY